MGLPSSVATHICECITNVQPSPPSTIRRSDWRSAVPSIVTPQTRSVTLLLHHPTECRSPSQAAQHVSRRQKIQVRLRALCAHVDPRPRHGRRERPATLWGLAACQSHRFSCELLLYVGPEAGRHSRGRCRPRSIGCPGWSGARSRFSPQ